jgi:hypothetical protein
MGKQSDKENSDLAVREVFHRADLATLQKNLEDYATKYNFLSPVVSIEWIPDFYSISAVRVPVDTRPMQDGGEVFEVGWAKEDADKKFALSKAPIDRIAMAAGADIIQVQRTDDRTDPHYCECSATVSIPDVGTGRARRVQGTAEIDLRKGSALCEKLIRENEKAYERKCKKAERENWKYPPKRTDPMVRIGEMRAMLVRRCETAAILRAYRRGFGIKPHYTGAELRKPFLILRLVESGQSDDPQMRRAYQQMALARMAGAADALFGYRDRPQEVVTATAIPSDDGVDRDNDPSQYVDPETGEVTDEPTSDDGPF